ncbi:MAG: RAMP superfamily CRISPR-associated protein, partial [bacterium]
MNKIKLTFRIHLLSDYHTGSGHSAGPTVDSALLRDYDGTPVLRGSKIVGLLRDGLWDLVYLSELAPLPALRQEFEDEKVDSPLTRLFGAAHAQKVWRYSSARPEKIMGTQKGLRWGSSDVTRIRIEPRLRRTDPQKLFCQEEGDRRLAFDFTATCYAPGPRDENDALMLIAAASMVRHLGASRRRGRGACRIELIKAEGLNGEVLEENPHKSALLMFKKRLFDEKQQNGADESDDRHRADSAHAKIIFTDQDKPLRFRMIARLDEPLVLARRGEAGNAYESLQMIHGGAISGALAKRAGRHLNLKSFDEKPYQPAPPDFAALFARGGISLSGLLPCDPRSNLADGELTVMMPIPLDIFICKNLPEFDKQYTTYHPSKPMTLTDELTPGLCCEDINEEKKCEAEYVNETSTFLPLKSGRYLTHRPEMREEAHIRTERKTGRVEEGNLFEYIALDAGQYFVGEISFANAACWEQFKLFTGMRENEMQEIYLGRASRRGHGRLVFYLDVLDSDASHSWILDDMKSRVNKSVVEQDGGFRMTLLTDTIMQDAWSRAYLSFDKTWVASLLGLEKTDFRFRGAFARSREIDSFHGHRRLPRWRDHAIVAGSSVGIYIEKNGWDKLEQLAKTNGKKGPDAAFAFLRERLALLEKQGIGLRRHEGFGRIAFNHPVSRKQNKYIEDVDKKLLPSGATHELYRAKDFELRKWKEKLDDYAKKDG